MPAVPLVIQVASALPLASMVTLGSPSGALPSTAPAFDQPACGRVVPPPVGPPFEPPFEPPPGEVEPKVEPGLFGDDNDAPPFVATSSPPQADSASAAVMTIHAMGFIGILFFYFRRTLVFRSLTRRTAPIGRLISNTIEQA